MSHYRAFDKDWFKRHQSKLLWLLNKPYLHYLTRWILRIHGTRSDVANHKIERIDPNAITWVSSETEYTTEFRGHDKFSKRVYYALRPVWWLMHAWDWAFADRWFPQLSFGFASLTVYPQTSGGGGNVSCDSPATHYSTGTQFTWTQVRDQTLEGMYIALTETENVHVGYLGASTTTDRWVQMGRIFFSFDTSSLTAAAIISAVTGSWYGSAGGQVQMGTPAINVYESTQANANTIVTADYLQVGSTAYCDTNILMSAWTNPGYNDFAFNSTGIAAIQKTGVTKTVLREAVYDVANSPPTWSSGASNFRRCYMADRTGTSEDPKLVITYTLAATKMQVVFIV